LPTTSTVWGSAFLKAAIAFSTTSESAGHVHENGVGLLLALP
jgi:hypothetical protein